MAACSVLSDQAERGKMTPTGESSDMSPLWCLSQNMTIKVLGGARWASMLPTIHHPMLGLLTHSLGEPLKSFSLPRFAKDLPGAEEGCRGKKGWIPALWIYFTENCFCLKWIGWTLSWGRAGGKEKWNLIWEQPWQVRTSDLSFSLEHLTVERLAQPGSSFISSKVWKWWLGRERETILR